MSVSVAQTEILAKVAAVNDRIQAAARRAGREAKAVTLVAVTKTHPLETVIAAYQAGLRHFGENRVFERGKVAEFKQWLADHPDGERATWHFIGHLQSRQVGDALGLYQLIHSVDSLKLARRIDRLAEREHVPPIEVLLQCNMSGEESKSGFDLSRWTKTPAQLDDLLALIAQVSRLKRIKIRGLMTMAPIVADAEETRPIFRNLARLQSRLQQERPDLDWGHLSMGMTDDFEVAIEEGATLVRVGRAVFGERQEL